MAALNQSSPLMHCIELNDAGILVAAGAEPLFESPGYMLLQDTQVELGERALQRSRLDPRHIHCRFWHRLSLDPLTHATGRFRHQADLAYAHLSHIATRLEGEPELIFAVPGSFDKEQLSLLLGIAREVPLRVVGLVDAAVAAIAIAAPERQVLHLDIQLHQALLTRLDLGEKVQRKTVVRVPDIGLAALRDQWLYLVAELFVAQCRFDPLHDAQTEQALYSKLPEWLAAVARQEEIFLEIESGGKRFQARLPRGRVIEVARPYYEQLRRAVAELSADDPQLVVTHRLALLPGLAKVLGSFTALPDNAAVAGAHRYAAAIRSEGEQLSFVTALPLATPVKATAPPERIAAEPSSSQPPARHATHVLLDHVAYPLARALAIGLDAQGHLRLAAAATEFNTPLARIRPAAEGLWLESQIADRLSLNGRPLAASAAVLLATGDRIDYGAQRLSLITALTEAGY